MNYGLPRLRVQRSPGLCEKSVSSCRREQRDLSLQPPLLPRLHDPLDRQRPTPRRILLPLSPRQHHRRNPHHHADSAALLTRLHATLDFRRTDPPPPEREEQKQGNPAKEEQQAPGRTEEQEGSDTAARAGRQHSRMRHCLRLYLDPDLVLEGIGSPNSEMR